MEITFSKDNVKIVSAYGTIEGGTLLHLQIAKLLVENSQTLKKHIDTDAQTRTLLLSNSAENDFLDFQAANNFKDMFKKPE
jgi:hypothetical protein